jgi:5-phospho-D-xylono-1,4-lactonase
MIIRTILGDISPSELNIVLGHEHIYAFPPPFVTDRDLYVDDMEASGRELADFRSIGGDAIVEMTTRDYNRDISKLITLSKQSGVHIVSATGFNKAKFANRMSSGMSEDEIADWMLSEVRDGIEGTSARAGVIKGASSLNGPDENELKVFRAAARAHLACNAPISTHTEKGTWATGQMELFIHAGVKPSRVLLGHLDLNPDIAYLREVAATGAYMGFDQFSKAKYLADERRIELVEELVSQGYGAQIILSHDLARRSDLRGYGGKPGFRHIPQTIRPNLISRGFDAELVADLCGHNARRFLSFEPI